MFKRVFSVRSRTFEQQFHARGTSAILSQPDHNDISIEPTATHSIFPLENHELANSRWEDDIIWDAEAMAKIPGNYLIVYFTYLTFMFRTKSAHVGFL